MATAWQDVGPKKDEEEMSTPAQVGKSEWMARLSEARMVKADLRRLLSSALVHFDVSALAQAALKLGELDDLIVRLEEIGRQTK
jgi:hypothetical protein